MADGSRTRLRRRLLRLGLLPLVLALALTLKVALMLGLDDRGRDAFADGRFDTATEAFAANAHVDLFEPWVSAFGEGTAEYRLADYPSARALLEDALRTVPEDRQCLVRINLALTREALGDAALADASRDRAEPQWREGIAVVDAGGCRREEAGSSVADRLADKLADRAEEETEDEVDDPASLEKLERRNDEAQEQRRRNEEIREDPTPPEDGEPTTPPTYSW